MRAAGWLIRAIVLIIVIFLISICLNVIVSCRKNSKIKEAVDQNSSWLTESGSKPPVDDSIDEIQYMKPTMWTETGQQEVKENVVSGEAGNKIGIIVQSSVDSKEILVDDYTEVIIRKYDKIISIRGESSIATKVKHLTGCRDKDFIPKILQHGEYTVLQNYIRADHGEIGCGESVTYVSHGDVQFIDNLIPVLERWRAPLGIALMSAGTDFDLTIKSIKYLRNCLPQSDLVRQFATFHIFFTSGHCPTKVPNSSDVLKTQYSCELPSPYANLSHDNLYKTQNNLSYPINVARNIAREAALTHYVFVCDIELYPSPDVPRKFLEMIVRNGDESKRSNPKVYPLPIFEIDANYPVPMMKTELQQRYNDKQLIIFHSFICAYCHKIPKFTEWISANESNILNVFTVAKRTERFSFWEPIFIGTNNDPIYDERLPYEGADDKMPQAFILCVLDYEFHVLDNAFLVHRPGIKKLNDIEYRNAHKKQTRKTMNDIIVPELLSLYGERNGCRTIGH